jgi:microcystin degradation protein MlrC
MSARVLVAQLFHETHGFNPHVTAAERIVVRRNGELLESARGTGTTLGGIVDRLTALRYEVVPSLGFLLAPSGPIEHACYASLRDELLARARREQVDAIALDLHGAMCTTECTDAEGDLLTRLRAEMAGIPIGIGLDMHAHVTRAMLNAVDICIACKECPHVDFHECGARVVDCLHSMLQGQLKPVRAMAKAPMIHLDSGLTRSAPLSEIIAHARDIMAREPAIRDISLFEVYRFSDYDEEKGATALVLANEAPEVAARAAQELAQHFWDERERFRSRLPSVEAALDRVAQDATRRPFVLGDTGDRVIAGAPGDSTVMLQAALKHPARLKGVVPVTDPESVSNARVAGVGARVALAIGGRLTPGFAPFPVNGTVTHVGDGQYEIAGPVLEGERASLGPTATLLIEGRLRALLTSEPGLTHTPSAFTSQGIVLEEQDFIVAKSGQHFHANFAGVATPLEVATPGLSHPAPGFFKWRKSRFWPEHDVGAPVIQAQVFTSERASDGA